MPSIAATNAINNRSDRFMGASKYLRSLLS
jgi:hypothetical protein